MSTMDHKHPDKSQPRPSGVDRPIEEQPRIHNTKDPYKDDPGAGSEDDERREGESEAEARIEEDVDLKVEDMLAHDIHRSNELADEDVVIDDDDVMPTGIQTGQTGRGSYSTDTSTGAGHYADHRSGTFGVDPVAQPGNDEDVEPDPIDTKIDR